jgi:hypothetical protein
MAKTYDGDLLQGNDDNVDPLPTDEAVGLANDILEFRSHKLNDWELVFCQGILTWVGDTITKKQTAVLNRLYDRVMR